MHVGQAAAANDRTIVVRVALHILQHFVKLSEVSDSTDQNDGGNCRRHEQYDDAEMHHQNVPHA